MKSDSPLSKAAVKRLVAELDAEIARLDGSIEGRGRQHSAIAQLRAICEPYMRENPRLTVAGALALDRRARPWAYRKHQ
ncbi:MAG: hypothetical protein LC126_24225 [Bryobacterales bacterium]|nr:hypothetical protein [Bryobacterales bacterium]